MQYKIPKKHSSAKKVQEGMTLTVGVITLK